jgi:hypothetical protein
LAPFALAIDVVVENQVLAAKWAVFSKDLRNSPSERIRVSARDKKIMHHAHYVRRIKHLQWGGVLTNQLFRLAPQRIDDFNSRLARAFCRSVPWPMLIEARTASCDPGNNNI